MEKKPGLRKVCKQIEQDYYTEKKTRVSIDPTTLSRLVKGGKTKSQSNTEKGWLLDAEVDIVIAYAIEVAVRGFPLSHQRFCEHVNDICRARLGDKFPALGVGCWWSDRFIKKYSNHLSMYWARPLDSAWGRAVNPVTNEAWFDLLKRVLDGGTDNTQAADDDTETETDDVEQGSEPIEEDCTYGVDESGFWPAGGTREHIIGAKGKKTQHQQGDGNCENTTVIVTICADGTSLPPAVIYKGKAFLVKWAQDNPTEASYALGYSLTTSYIDIFLPGWV